MSEEEGFEQLRKKFLEDLAVKVKNLEAAVAESNWDAISRISHQIGGSAKSFGYPDVSAAARELERSVRKISLIDAAGLVKKILDNSVL